ncbi:MAG: hypothetical protein QXW39_07185 [Candidatus Bathyarchaeia archaeon]
MAVATIGGLHVAILNASVTNIHYFQLLSSLYNAYWSLFILSAFVFYFYPYVINVTLVQTDSQCVRKTASLPPLYSIGLGYLAIFGFFVYGIPVTLKYEHLFPASMQGMQIVSGMIFTLLPLWLSGVAQLGIFIVGLVPAAIMAIASANLFTKNIAKEIKFNMTSKREKRTAQVFCCNIQVLCTWICIYYTGHIYNTTAAFRRNTNITDTSCIRICYDHQKAK